MAYLKAFQNWINNLDGGQVYMRHEGNTVPMEVVPFNGEPGHILYFGDAIDLRKITYNITIPRGTRFCPSNRHSVVADIANPAQNQGSQYYLTLDEPISFNIDGDYFVLNVSINGIRADVVGFDINDIESVKKYEESHTVNMPIFAPAGLRYHVNDADKDPIGLIHSFENRQMIKIEPNSTIILNKGAKIAMKSPVSEACVKDGKCPECENYKNNNMYTELLQDVKAKI